MAGWVKVYRKLLDDPIVCKDSDYLAVWIYILLEATHKNIDALFQKERITLNPGQLITGRKSISKKLHISESKVQRILKTFEIEQQIEQQTSTQNRLITILKWESYQQSEQQTEQQVNNERTTSEQRVNTNKNVKNEKNEKNERIKDSNNIMSEDNHLAMIKYDVDHQYYQIAKYLKDKILLINDKSKVPTDNPKSMEKWADDVRKIIELDKRTTGEFKEIIDFTFKSDFWATVIQSPAGLRKNWDKVFAQMKRPKASNSNVISFDRQMEVCREFLEEG